MEIKTIKVKTTRDLRPFIDILDMTEEPVESILLLIQLGAARAAEFANIESNEKIEQRAVDIINAVETVREKWSI